MTDTGFKFSGTQTNTALGHTGTNPTFGTLANVNASDNVYLTITHGSGTNTSDYLHFTNFDMSAIPSGATIDGIEVTIERKSGTANRISDEVIQLVVGGSHTGTNLGDTVTKWPLAEGTVTYGGATSKWGLTPTYTDVVTNQSTFGVAVKTTNNAQGAVVGSIDAIQLKVYYTAAGIAFDAASNSGYQTAQSTYSWNHTVTGSNTYLTVGIAMLSVAGSSVSSITFNGVAMAFLGAKASVSGAVRAELWGLVAPTAGTHSISVTLTTSLDSAGGAVSYTGVNQVISTESLNSASATNVGAADATVNVTTIANDDWVVDITASDDTAITVGTGNTSRSNVTGALGSGAMGDTNGAITPAGLQAMSWTSVGALATWSIVGMALRPVGSDVFDFMPFF